MFNSKTVLASILVLTISAQSTTWDPSLYTCSTTTLCSSYSTDITGACCGTVSGCSGDQATTYTDGTTYCIPDGSANGVASVSTADDTCTGMCSSVSATTCTPDDNNWCGGYDTDSITYCCAVTTSNSDGTYTANSGVCTDASTVDSSVANAGGDYTVCGAVSLALSSAVLALAF